MHSKGNNQEAEAAERRKMVENSRKSNFAIGELNKMNDKQYACDTSSKAAYRYDFLQNKDSLNDKNNIMDFKVANFKFGSQNTNYVTTNTDEYDNDRIQNCMKQIMNKNTTKENIERLNR